MRFVSTIRRPSFLLLLASVVTLAAGACSEPAPAAPPAPVVKSAQERAQVYQDCWNQFNNKAWDTFQNCYTADAKSESVDSNPAVVTGRAAIIETAKQAAAGFPDRRGELRLVLVNGSHGATIALYTGTNTGPMPGPDGKPVPPTNKPVGFLMAHTLEFDSTGSAAMSDAGYIDEGTLTAQLGVNPSPARPVEKATGAPAVVVLAKNDDTERANLAATQAIFDAVNKHDVKAIGLLLADSYKSIEIARPMDLGKKESLASTKEMFGSFPDVKITPTTTWAAGDYVVIYGTFEGTNTGDMPSMKMKKTGKHVLGRFCEIVKFEGGKATDDYLFYNGAAFMAQLGVK